jgi:hypothetical protein
LEVQLTQAVATPNFGSYIPSLELYFQKSRGNYVI